ncbi:Uncharacterized protein QTN25_003631 [Entamoeba marina]
MFFFLFPLIIVAHDFPLFLNAEVNQKFSQNYNSTVTYSINLNDLVPSSLYEIKIHSLGSIPTVYGVSLLTPKQYSTNNTFLDESNLQFKTNTNKCIEVDDQIYCNTINVYVTLLYMGRTTHPSILAKGVTYYITLKKGHWGLPGNVPILAGWVLCCLLISALLTFWIVRQFFSLPTGVKIN